MDTEFNITQEELEKTGFGAQDTAEGIKNIESVFQAEYTYNKYWSLFSAVQLESYLGEAADSPITKSDATVGAVCGALFRFQLKENLIKLYLRRYFFQATAGALMSF